MITTRSGKSHVGYKPNFDKENIFDQSVEENRKRKTSNKTSQMDRGEAEPLKSHSHGSDRETTRKRILSDLNMNKISHTDGRAISSNNASSMLKEDSRMEENYTEQKVNKINISNDEKMMNGAPEGDLYELVVLQDDELPPFDSHNIAQSEFELCFEKHYETTIWAEKYEFVTIIRRVLIHHIDVLADVDFSLISSVVDIMIEATASLRSCVIRNGLLCLRRFLRYFNTLVDASECSELTVKIVGALLSRTANGPKFICETANEILIIAAVERQVPVLTFFKGLLPYATHRSPEVSSKAIILSTKCVQAMDNLSTTTTLSGTQQYKDPLKIAAIGLTTRLAKGKEAAKDALKLIQSRLSPAAFKDFAAKALSPSESAEVMRLIETDKAFNGSSHSNSNSSSAGSSSGSVGSASNSSNFRKFRPPAVVTATRSHSPMNSNVFPKVSSSNKNNNSNSRLSADRVCCGNITPKKKGLVIAAQSSSLDCYDGVPVAASSHQVVHFSAESALVYQPTPPNGISASSSSSPMACSPSLRTGRRAQQIASDSKPYSSRSSEGTSSGPSSSSTAAAAVPTATAPITAISSPQSFSPGGKSSVRKKYSSTTSHQLGKKKDSDAN